MQEHSHIRNIPFETPLFRLFANPNHLYHGLDSILGRARRHRACSNSVAPPLLSQRMNDGQSHDTVHDLHDFQHGLAIKELEEGQRSRQSCG